MLLAHKMFSANERIRAKMPGWYWIRLPPSVHLA
jgi:hypothetical protein